MTSTPPEARACASARGASHPRLTLAPRSVGHGQVAGRWWPRTGDLAVELPALLAAVAHRVGAVDRISLDPETWTRRARTVTVDERAILLDWFSARHRHTIGLHGTPPAQLDLLVIPPDTPTIVALACLAMPAPTAVPELEEESRWEDDGGRLQRPLV